MEIHIIAQEEISRCGNTVRLLTDKKLVDVSFVKYCFKDKQHQKDFHFSITVI